MSKPIAVEMPDEANNLAVSRHVSSHMHHKCRSEPNPGELRTGAMTWHRLILLGLATIISMRIGLINTSKPKQLSEQ
jgi:hypothetical protein